MHQRANDNLFSLTPDIIEIRNVLITMIIIISIDASTTGVGYNRKRLSMRQGTGDRSWMRVVVVNQITSFTFPGST